MWFYLSVAAVGILSGILSFFATELIWVRRGLISRWYLRHFSITMPGLCVFRFDPLFALVGNSPERCKNICLFFMYAVAFVVPKILISYESGRLISETFYQDFSIDLHTFPIFRVFTKDTSFSVQSSSSPYIPYVRDYVDIGLSFLMAAHMVLLHSKWKNISRALSELWEGGVLNRNVITPEQYQGTIVKYERRFNSILSYLLPLLFSLAGCVMFFWVFDRLGMYSSLNPTGQPSWELQAGKRWWAHPGTGVASSIFQACWLIFVLYYMLRHNVVGCLAVVMGRDILGGKSNEPVFLLDPDHPDKFGGINLLRVIMLQVAASVLIMGFCLLLTYYIMPTGTARLLIPFFLIFFILNPVYIFVPIMLVNGQIRSSKIHRTRSLRENLTCAEQANDGAQIVRLKWDLSQLEKLPTDLLSIRQIISFVVLYLIPIILFLDWIQQKFALK